MHPGLLQAQRRHRCLIYILTLFLLAVTAKALAAPAKHTRNEAELKILGEQVADMYLRGYFWPERKPTRNCWKNEQIPNVYLEMHDYTLGDDRALLKKTLERQRANLLMLPTYKIISEAVTYERADLGINFDQTGEFVYRFKIVSGDSFVGCKKEDKDSFLAACLKPELTKDKGKAFSFEISAIAIPLTKDADKEALAKLGKPARRVIHGSREPNSFHLLKKECWVDKPGF